MVKTAIKSRERSYGGRPVETPSWTPISTTTNFGRNVGLGACSGFLAFSGALRLTGTLAPEGFAALHTGLPAALTALTGTVFAGKFAAPAELIIAAVLFLMAGRGPARVLGFWGFVAFAMAYANGVNVTEMLGIVQSAISSVEAFVQQIQAA